MYLKPKALICELASTGAKWQLLTVSYLHFSDFPDKNIFNYFAASGINTPDCESSQ